MQIRRVWNRALQAALILALGVGSAPERVRANGQAEVRQFPISTGTLAIRAGAVPLEPARWKLLLSGRGFRYADPTRAAGGVARIVLRLSGSGEGRLEIRAGGASWLYEILADHSVVSVLLTIGETRWCALFPDPTTSGHKVRGRSERPPACA